MLDAVNDETLSESVEAKEQKQSEGERMQMRRDECVTTCESKRERKREEKERALSESGKKGMEWCGIGIWVEERVNAMGGEVTGRSR
jgi:hypothetical protein